ncbi:SpoIIE family protein phosphatase [Streptomyces sp. NPDC002573]|uniref:SpoIIE family protein phosphatase n=1 Tax=Streptomyces sp. NPDC002573 TaxID=3364651 RepID=UPI00367D1918
MTSSSAAGEHRRGGGSGQIQGTDLAAVVHRAVREALQRLTAVTAAVYLLDEDHAELHLAMIGGSPPSFFTLPGRMGLDTPYASARALASGQPAVLVDPDPAEADQQHVPPYPYVALSVPVVDADRRFGALTVLRLETFGTFRATEQADLQEIGNELATALAQLAENGAAIAAGPTPMLVPVGHPSICTPGWGVSGVPGSAGTSLMYPLRRLEDLLNQATTMEAIVGAARYYVMYPFRAQALVLASANDGRLWVLGHSGASSGMVRSLHGAGLDARTPAAEAIRGRPLFISDSRSTAADLGWSEVESQAAEAYLPLFGGAPITEPLPFAGSKRVVGVCCLSFKEPRRFPPEERATLSMMAGSLGAAVERVELNTKQHAAAEYLQRRLLPARLSELPRLTTTARYQPATVTSKVGGDWYDVIRLPGERVVLVVGDVEGHAMGSAAVMGQVRTAVAAYATEGHRPAAVIDRTGRLLAELGTDLFVTCCVVALDTADGTVEVALAGHPEPLVQRPDGSIWRLEAPANVPLSVATPDAYRGREHTLEPGSLLMLYSNGLVDWDTADPGDGAQVLLRSCSREAGADLERLADRLIADVSYPQQRRDDAVLLLARYERAIGESTLRTASLQIQQRDLQGVKAARSFVDDRLSAWGLAEMSDALQLIASEIVTNALIHAGSDVDVRLRGFADHVRLEVRDSDSNPPVPSPLALGEEENAEAEHGRGLLIVEALSGSWYSSPNGRGKTVSVEVPIAEAEP